MVTREWRCLNKYVWQLCLDGVVFGKVDKQTRGRYWVTVWLDNWSANHKKVGPFKTKEAAMLAAEMLV